MFKKNISDGVGSRNESIHTPLDPPLFWLDNIFNSSLILIYLLPSVRALEVAAHNFVEPTVTEHEGLELEAARSQQVNGLLVLVRKPELTRRE